MTLSFIEPRPELRPYVEALWVFESPTGLPAAEGNIAAPNGCCKITFAYGNSFVSIANGRASNRPAQRLNFVGNRDSSIVLQSSLRQIGCIGIEFLPCGALPVVGIPMRETLNFIGDADVVLGEWARRVEEVLGTLQNAHDRVAVLQEQLIRRLQKSRSGALMRKHQSLSEIVAYCVGLLQSTDGRIPIRELERRSGYSRRYLELLFLEHVGL